MDADKLKKHLEKIAAGPDGPAAFAKYIGQVVDRLKKATDHLAAAAKHVGQAMEHNEKMSDHMDALGEHHDAMADHMSGMKDCMGKAIATGKLGKVEDAGDAKDMTTHLSGIESAHSEMGKTHGAIEKLIADQEEALDNADGAIDDAVDSADEETDKGLAAAERTEKMRKRDNAKLRKSLERKHGRDLSALTKKFEKTSREQIASVQDGFSQLLKALAPVPAAPAGIEKVTPSRTVTMEKNQDGSVRGPAAAAVSGATPEAQVATGISMPAVDEHGMPNPEYLKAVEAGTLGKGGGSAFVKAAREIEPQVGNPFPEQFGAAGAVN